MKLSSFFYWFLWISAILLMVGSTLYYSSDAGELGTPNEDLSGFDSLISEKGKSSLLFFFHPKCPCTAASIAELKNILFEINPSDIEIIGVSLADSTDREWAESQNYRDFNNIKGSKIIDDYGGQIAERYGAKTSGITGLYDQEGKLVFWGGLTAARGHEGRSPAHDIIISHFNNQTSQSQHQFTDVFGCGLADSVCLEIQ